MHGTATLLTFGDLQCPEGMSEVSGSVRHILVASKGVGSSPVVVNRMHTRVQTLFFNVLTITAIS